MRVMSIREWHVVCFDMGSGLGWMILAGEVNSAALKRCLTGASAARR